MKTVNRLPRIEHLDLNEKVYRILRERILRREFEAGKKLDIYLLAEQLDVSRTPVKDALHRLARERLVDIIPRRGTFVSQLSIADVEELFEIRSMIELWAAEKGLEKMSGREVRKLERLVEKGGRILEKGKAGQFDYAAFSGLNAQLHLKMVECAGNNKLVDMYRSLHFQIQIARAVYKDPFEPCRLGQEEHEKILKAYQAGELVSLKKAIEKHLERALSGIVKIMEARGGVL